MVFKLNEEIKKLNKSLHDYGFSKFKTDAKNVEKLVNVEGIKQGHWDEAFATWQDYLRDTPNAYDVKRNSYTEEQEFEHRVGSVYNAFAVVVTEWFYNKISTETNQNRKKEWWDVFCEIRNVINNPSAEAAYGNDIDKDGDKDSNLRSWAKSEDGTAPYYYNVNFDEAIKWMKEEAKKQETGDDYEEKEGEELEQEEKDRIEDKELTPLQIKAKYLARHIENRLKLYPTCEEKFNERMVADEYFNDAEDWKKCLEEGFGKIKAEEESKQDTVFRECEKRVLHNLTNTILDYLLDEETQPDVSERFKRVTEYLNLYIKGGEYNPSRNGEREAYLKRIFEIDELEKQLSNSLGRDWIATRYGHVFEESLTPVTKLKPKGEISSKDIRSSLLRIVNALTDFKKEAQEKLDENKEWREGDTKEGIKEWLGHLEAVIAYLSKKVV